MALKKQMCTNHPDRMAIGICMMTQKPICAECSTRYEGVNYSKEGLALLKKEREGKSRGRGNHAFVAFALFFVPLALFFLYHAYRLTGVLLIDLAQWEL